MISDVSTTSLTREVLIEKIPKIIRIRNEFLNTGWWYERYKGILFEVKTSKKNDNYYVVRGSCKAGKNEGNWIKKEHTIFVK